MPCLDSAGLAVLLLADTCCTHRVAMRDKRPAEVSLGQLGLDFGVWQVAQVLQAALPLLLHQAVQNGLRPSLLRKAGFHPPQLFSSSLA